MFDDDFTPPLTLPNIRYVLAVAAVAALLLPWFCRAGVWLFEFYVRYVHWVTGA